MMKVLKHLTCFLNNIFEYFAYILLSFLVLFTAADVFCRYFLQFSFRWSEELSLILLIWFCFITMSIGIKERLHFSVNLFLSKAGPKVKFLINKLVDFLVLFFHILLTIYGVLLIQTSTLSTLPATGISTSALYYMIPLSGFITVLNMGLDFFGVVKMDVKSEKADDISN